MPSILHGPDWSDPPVNTVPEALFALARVDAPWLTLHQGSRATAISREGGLRLALAWAAALREAGVGPGDRVAVIQPNDEGFIGAFFGTQLLGATPVPLAWPLVSGASKAETVLAPLVRAADPAAVATPAHFAPRCAFGPPIVTAPSGMPLSMDAPPALDPSLPAFIQFTSGTTGSPRGAMISHAAAVGSAWAMGLALGQTESDVGVSWLPLFHDMGLVGVLLCSLVHRFPIHLLTPAEFLLHPTRWIERLADAGATLTVAPNFGYDLAARRADRKFAGDLRRVRRALDGAEPVHRATIEAFEARFAANGWRPGALIPVYGLAENTLGVCFADPDHPMPDLSRDGRRIPSVGRPLPGMAVGIRRPDGTLAPAGGEGEIVVRGPCVMSGYFRDPVATAAARDGAWLRTGDLGVIRDGVLHVTGREKDLVIKGGRKFHPYDIERVVALAVDAPPNGVAAFSTPNEATGTEDLVVVVELRRRGEEDPVRVVRGRLMEELGLRADHVRLVGAGALPRTTSGKVRRRECAALYGPVAEARAADVAS